MLCLVATESLRMVEFPPNYNYNHIRFKDSSCRYQHDFPIPSFYSNRGRSLSAEHFSCHGERLKLHRSHDVRPRQLRFFDQRRNRQSGCSSSPDVEFDTIATRNYGDISGHNKI